MKLNEAVYEASNGHTLVYQAGDLGGYYIIQVQERDRAGWTLIYEADGSVIGIINWQACGVCIYTNDYRLTKKLQEYEDLDVHTGQTDFTVSREEFNSLLLGIKSLAFSYVDYRSIACVRELRNFGFTDYEIESEGPYNDKWIKSALKAAN